VLVAPGFAKLIDIAAPGGRICFYGGGTGNITDIVPAKVFFKQLNIYGSTMGTEQEFNGDMVQFVDEKGRLCRSSTRFTA
jgi:zinc-binding alcohol dehydrogenase/oxidoreductase